MFVTARVLKAFLKVLSNKISILLVSPLERTTSRDFVAQRSASRLARGRLEAYSKSRVLIGIKALANTPGSNEGLF